MTLQLKRAERKNVKLKLGIAAPSGGGKTYSALLLAKGLVGKWEKVAVIDTENGSANLYEHLGAFSVVELSPPFEPERYTEALKLCIKDGMEVVIIDSMSHEWTAEGGILDYQAKLGGKFQDWAKATPRHRKFIDAILQAPVHVICTSRVKSDWAIEQNDKGKAVPIKLGLKAEQREGMEYELTVSWRLGVNNMATVEKDRTGLFYGKPDFKISEKTGEELLAWAKTGKESPKSAGYDNNAADHKKWLQEQFNQLKVPKEKWKNLAQQMIGQPMEQQTLKDLTAMTGIFEPKSVASIS